MGKETITTEVTMNNNFLYQITLENKTNTTFLDIHIQSMYNRKSAQEDYKF
jgi:hypothetical protein